jgi:esterase/lipase
MIRKILFSLPVLLIIIYFAGPAPSKPQWSTVMPVVPQEPAALEQYVADQESKHKIKPGNDARIVWFDSTKKKTEYSVVYLHGFSASREEGNPIHTDFAKKFGCNLYLSRLADHGIDTTEQLLNFTTDRFWESAKEALAIGKAIGEKVIVMSTSTGGTVALVLAADFPDDVHALINMSPNLAINDPNAWILNNHWGLQIARKVVGSDYNDVHFDSIRQKYWNGRYRMEATVQLQEMIESKMNKDTFKKVLCPSLTLYYYKNEKEQDPTVKVSAMLEMNKELGTPEPFKQTVAIPEAGGHVIGSYVVSKDLKSVEREVNKFAMEKLKMTPRE